MRYITMERALKKMGTKNAVAKACNVSPAAVSKACADAANGINVKVGVDGDKVLGLFYEQAKWRKVEKQKQKAGKRTRNY